MCINLIYKMIKITHGLRKKSNVASTMERRKYYKNYLGSLNAAVTSIEG